MCVSLQVYKGRLLTRIETISSMSAESLTVTMQSLLLMSSFYSSAQLVFILQKLLDGKQVLILLKAAQIELYDRTSYFRNRLLSEQTIFTCCRSTVDCHYYLVFCKLQHSIRLMIHNSSIKKKLIFSFLPLMLGCDNSLFLQLLNKIC